MQRWRLRSNFQRALAVEHEGRYPPPERQGDVRGYFRRPRLNRSRFEFFWRKP